MKAHDSTVARLALVFLLVLSGCGPESLDRTYGRRRGSPGGDSVNGTAVLARMFVEMGYRVRTWSRLSPKLEESHAIVWAPDDFTPPDRERREFLEQWLSREERRTLIYVGRDYDAALEYWRRAQVDAPAAQFVEVSRRLARVRSDLDTARRVAPQSEDCDWFQVHSDTSRRTVSSLTGPWAQGVDAAQTDIELTTRLVPPNADKLQDWVGREDYPWSQAPSFRTLLASRGDQLVTEIAFPNQSRILVVANGSFLLNLPLVNHEHRKLAVRVIAECEPPGPVVFLQSSAGGPMILGEDPDANYPTGLEIFTVWPLGVIMLHLAAAGILLCVALFPIFGPAYRWRRSSPSDFGKHVVALGQLLELTNDRQYAVERVKYYYEHVRRDSGQSHRTSDSMTPSADEQPAHDSRQESSPN